MSNDYPLFDERSGKYYRNIGGIMEYEPELMTTCGNLRESEISGTISAMKSAKEKELAKLREEINPQGICPFRGECTSKRCQAHCAWWSGSECALKSASAIEIRGGSWNQVGVIRKQCPISQGICDSDCVFRANNECKLLNIIKGDRS